MRPSAELRRASVVCFLPSGNATLLHQARSGLFGGIPHTNMHRQISATLIKINEVNARQRAIILRALEDRRDCPDDTPSGASILTGRCSAYS
jgi:hypothetical protein